MPLSKLIPWVGFLVITIPLAILVVVDMIRRSTRARHLDGEGGYNSTYHVGDGDAGSGCGGDGGGD